MKPCKITPEAFFVNRRRFMKHGAFGFGALASSLWLRSSLLAKPGFVPSIVPDADSITSQDLFLSYNNFYEFSLNKTSVKEKAQAMSIDNWSVLIDGEVEEPFSISLEELKGLAPMEERVYRFRCVEAWSAVVPWQGYPLYNLIKRAKPKSTAQYVSFTSFLDPKVMPGLGMTPGYPWPYTEGLRLDEAQNELTLLTFGHYGKPLTKQNGAPVRLIVPWKYGFKSAKSLVNIRFTTQKPKTLWNTVGPSEYGFYANVNPNVDHPRWSQKTEKPIGNLFQKEPTLLFNGYERDVAHLYKGMDLVTNF